MNIKKLIIAFIFLNALLFGMVVGFVSAEEYPINNPIEYSKVCINNGTYCSPTTTCYLTLKDKNNKVILSSAQMNYANNLTNYTIPARSDLGKYYSTIVCCDNGKCGSEDYTFEVTSTGDNRNNSLLYLLLIAASLVFIFGYFTHNVWFVYISGIMFLITGVYSIMYGFNNIRDTFTDTIGYVSIGFGILFFVIGAYEQLSGDEEVE